MGKVAICQWCIPVGGPAALEMAAKMGYDGVEMDMGFGKPEQNLLQPEVLEKFLEVKSCCGIQTPSLAFNGLSLKKAEERENREEIMKKAVEIAVRLEAKVLQMPSFFEDGIKTEEDFAETARSLKNVCQLAAKYGITVGTENQLDVKQNLRMIAQVEESNFAVYFDNANPYLFDKRDGMDMLRELYPHICEVHVKDFSLWGRKPCKPLGKGGCHAKDMLEFLKEKNYDRWVVSENSLPEKKLIRDAAWIRKIMGE